MKKTFLERIGVCSWSLRPATPTDLVVELKAAGISRVQLALDPLRESRSLIEETETLFRQNGIHIVSGMFGTAGEDYSTLETIRATGGIAPDSTWSENLARIHANALIASELCLSLVTFHAGFLPDDPADPNFAKMLKRVTQVAEIFGARNISVALETGQETALNLAVFLRKLNCRNLGVNFDPANIILYDKGDPIEALRTLRPWLRQAHIKDAKRTTAPGTWGVEVVAGEGEVDWPKFFSVLRETQFAGDFVIEREAGEQRLLDVCAARDLLLQLNCVP
ncbi:MAG TPA: sugar phosphate isomerase/epimerase family protein [Verrucomicrobiae bacterium]|jgi:sugar phosphate isomerase/epimerase|nr:sugar phosphate isomerase/epimerase family protein [Verrucomicrobiae bacterium]